MTIRDQDKHKMYFLALYLENYYFPTICVHPWSVTNFAQRFTFQTFTIRPVVCQFWAMKRYWLCYEIDHVFDGVFIHVLFKFSGFPWERRYL